MDHQLINDLCFSEVTGARFKKAEEFLFDVDTPKRLVGFCDEAGIQRIPRAGVRSWTYCMDRRQF
eukprot:8545843-Pyramimonas_sp.AAC.1